MAQTVEVVYSFVIDGSFKVQEDRSKGIVNKSELDSLSKIKTEFKI
jgi:hypothetical protein